jgi:glycosyltransferase involved in cell wall biosynthesis
MVTTMPGYKISFCTVCMNRLHHLKQTLERNITDNSDYENVEFLVLDYHSSDGLQAYLKKHFNSIIKSGKLKLFRTTEPKFFKRSHSRNMAFMLASGDIVCNIDADNYTGPGFATFVNDAFMTSAKCYLTTLGPTTASSNDILGRICVMKKDFLAVSGYDEKMQGYGFEDIDFANRLKIFGLQKRTITENIYLSSLSHDVEERIANEYLIRTTRGIYMRHLTPSTTEILLLFKDKHYEKALLIDTFPECQSSAEDAVHDISVYTRFDILKDSWESGSWRREARKIFLSNTIYNGNIQASQGTIGNPINEFLVSDQFQRIRDPKLKNTIIILLGEIANRQQMLENIRHKRLRVNSDCFGQAEYQAVIL